MEMILWSLLHEVNTVGWNCNYTRTYMWLSAAGIYGSIA